MFDIKRCCLCNKPIIGYGNNAEPVKSGICCNKCNVNIVIPARFELIINERYWMDYIDAFIELMFNKDLQEQFFAELAELGISLDNDFNEVENYEEHEEGRA